MHTRVDVVGDTIIVETLRNSNEDVLIKARVEKSSAEIDRLISVSWMVEMARRRRRVSKCATGEKVSPKSRFSTCS
jgi:hypothetical protein